MKKTRTVSICIDDIPRESIFKHDNGKKYLSLVVYDRDSPDKYGNDVSVSLPLTDEQKEAKKRGDTVDRVFLGNGKTWSNEVTEEEYQEMWN